MYLATVIDCFCRADHMRVELVQEALGMATGQRGSLLPILITAVYRTSLAFLKKHATSWEYNNPWGL